MYPDGLSWTRELINSSILTNSSVQTTLLFSYDFIIYLCSSLVQLSVAAVTSNNQGIQLLLGHVEYMDSLPKAGWEFIMV